MIRNVLLAIAIILSLCNAARSEDRRNFAIFPELELPITVEAQSLDGRFKATAGGDTMHCSDRAIEIWDSQSARELRTLTGHRCTVTTIAFSPDSKVLASASLDDTVKLWDAANGRLLRTLRALRNQNVTDGAPLAFSPDSKLLATGDDRGDIKLWDVASGRLRRAESTHDRVDSLAFSPDGKILAAIVGSKTAHILALANGSVRKIVSAHTDIAAIAIAPGGKILASGDEAGRITLWNISNGRAHRTVSGPAGPVTKLSFSADGKKLTSETVTFFSVWETASGRLLDRGIAAAETYPKGIPPVSRTSAIGSISFSPDGKVLVAAGRLWNSSSGIELQEPFGSVAGFTKNGEVLAKEADDTFKLWDLNSARELHSWRVRKGSRFALSPDGSVAATFGLNGPLTLWDSQSGRQLSTLSRPSSISTGPSASFSQDGKLLATFGEDIEGTVDLWDVASGRNLHTLVIPHVDYDTGATVHSVAFSPDNRVLATAGSEDGAVDLWEIATWRKVRTLSGPSGVVLAVAFSPDGKELASGGDNDTVDLWDVVSGRRRLTLSGHLGAVTSLAFSADGNWLASASSDGTTRMWDVATGTEHGSLVAFDDGSSIAVTPQGYFNSSSPKAEQNLNVRIGEHVYGISSFRERFYRPDLVKLSLAGQSLAGLETLDDIKLSPIVTLFGEPATVTEPKLAVNLKLERQDGGIGAVRVFWNGAAVLQDAGDPRVLTRNYTVALPHDASGENELRVTIENAAGSMWSEATAPISVKLATRAHPRGALYAVVVGVNDFPGLGPDFSLNYSVADARLIKSKIETYAAGMFDDVKVKLLTTREETAKKSILNAIKEIKTELSPDDTFVLYFVSHGAVTKDGEYYLLTASTRTDSVADAISRRELSGLLADLPAVRKIAFIDACFAGTLGDPKQADFATRGMNEKVAATLMGNDLGVTILMAGGDKDLALEGFKNQGLFTWVAAQGLGGAAPDSKDPKLITSVSLSDYVAKEVAEIATTLYGRTQIPILVAPEKQPPFPVARVN